MRVGVFLPLLFPLLMATPQAASMEQFEEHYIRSNKAAAQSWWRRAINKLPDKLQTKLGISFGPKFGRSVGVVIGIGQYDFWDGLNAPANDAMRVRNFLVEEAGFDEVYTFINSSINLNKFNDLVSNKLPSVLNQNDRLFFYWSGHGGEAIDFAGRKFGFLPLGNGRVDGTENAVFMDDIDSWIRRFKAKHALFVIDSCFSGLAGRAKSSNVRKATFRRISKPAHYVLTSSASNQRSYGYADGSGSVFTSAFLNSVRGSADDNPTDGIVTLKEILSNTQTTLDKFSYRFNYQMSPGYYTVGADEGEFFFLTPNFESVFNPAVDQQKNESLIFTLYEEAITRKSIKQMTAFRTAFPNSLLDDSAERFIKRWESDYAETDEKKGKSPTLERKSIAKLDENEAFPPVTAEIKTNDADQQIQKTKLPQDTFPVGRAEKPAERLVFDEDVKQMQFWLKRLGYYAYRIDGLYGRYSASSVKNFLKKYDNQNLQWPSGKVSLMALLETEYESLITQNSAKRTEIANAPKATKKRSSSISSSKTPTKTGCTNLTWGISDNPC